LSNNNLHIKKSLGITEFNLYLISWNSGKVPPEKWKTGSSFAPSFLETPSHFYHTIHEVSIRFSKLNTKCFIK
jgi:hypothetical protein